MSESSEYKRFDRTIRKLMRVSHAEIKARLEAERKAKKRKKARQSSDRKSVV